MWNCIQSSLDIFSELIIIFTEINTEKEIDKKKSDRKKHKESEIQTNKRDRKKYKNKVHWNRIN